MIGDVNVYERIGAVFVQDDREAIIERLLAVGQGDLGVRVVVNAIYECDPPGSVDGCAWSLA